MNKHYNQLKHRSQGQRGTTNEKQDVYKTTHICYYIRNKNRGEIEDEFTYTKRIKTD